MSIVKQPWLLDSGRGVWYISMHMANTSQTPETPAKAPRPATLTALAIVGFIALILLGIWLAIYSAQYVPSAITKLTSGTNTGIAPAQLTIVSATSTAYSQNAASIPSNPVNPAAQLPGVGYVPSNGQQSYTAPQSYQPRAPYGLPDLAVTIIATGYLTADSADSFVPAHIIPPGARPAVKFSIANNGTNVTGPWNFLAMIPSFGGSVFHSPMEPSLNPGDHTVFTLGFSQAIPGPAQAITIVADPDNLIAESNEGNNSASAAVTITATGN
jgi:hypothetical protein